MYTNIFSEDWGKERCFIKDKMYISEFNFKIHKAFMLLATLAFSYAFYINNVFLITHMQIFVH